MSEGSDMSLSGGDGGVCMCVCLCVCVCWEIGGGVSTNDFVG